MPRRRNNSYDDYDNYLNAWGNHQDYMREMAEAEEHEAAMEAWRLANPEAAAKRDAEQAEWDKWWAENHPAEARRYAATAVETETVPATAKPATAKPATAKPATATPKPKVSRAGLLEQEDGWTKVVKRR